MHQFMYGKFSSVFTTFVNWIRLTMILPLVLEWVWLQVIHLAVYQMKWKTFLTNATRKVKWVASYSDVVKGEPLWKPINHLKNDGGKIKAKKHAFLGQRSRSVE